MPIGGCTVRGEYIRRGRDGREEKIGVEVKVPKEEKPEVEEDGNETPPPPGGAPNGGGANRKRAHIEKIEKDGVKFGLRIKEDQAIAGMALRAAGEQLLLCEDAAVSAELIAAVGTDPGERWVGFRVPPLGTFPDERPNEARIGFHMEFGLRDPTAFAARALQVIPVVLAFGDQAITEHYLVCNLTRTDDGPCASDEGVSVIAPPVSVTAPAG